MEHGELSSSEGTFLLMQNLGKNGKNLESRHMKAVATTYTNKQDDGWRQKKPVLCSKVSIQCVGFCTFEWWHRLSRGELWASTSTQQLLLIFPIIIINGARIVFNLISMLGYSSITWRDFQCGWEKELVFSHRLIFFWVHIQIFYTRPSGKPFLNALDPIWWEKFPFVFFLCETFIDRINKYQTNVSKITFLNTKHYRRSPSH